MSTTRKRLSAGFIAVIVFKVLKGAAFVLFGIVALRLARANEMPSAIQIAKFLSISRENELVRRVADVVSAVTPRQATAAGIASFLVAAVFLVEGTLLTARVWWSTFFTIVLTACGVPIEIYEIVRHPGSLRRYALLVVNLAILLYLWSRRNEFRKTKA